MNFRFMRMLLFFDLPREDSKQRRNATVFVKKLIKDGFYMLQESVYCKLVLNSTDVETIKARVKKYKPLEGNIMILTITEKQFNNIDIILGENSQMLLNDTERIIFI